MKTPGTAKKICLYTRIIDSIINKLHANSHCIVFSWPIYSFSDFSKKHPLNEPTRIVKSLRLFA